MTKQWSRRGNNRRNASRIALQKPHGTLHPRVQKVGPEHFGIVCVDCAKGRSKWLLGDFYHKLFIEPTFVEHQRGQLNAMILRILELARQHQIQDLVVSIERTGDYHLPVKRAFDAAEFAGRKFDTRIVHPFATKQHRQPANPGDKTDDHDRQNGGRTGRGRTGTGQNGGRTGTASFLRR